MKARMYGYSGCGTCKKASKWLTAQGVEVEQIAIRETPPSIDELKRALEAKGSLKLLFNTSGMDYRAMNMKEVLPTLSEEEALKLLSENGNLVKRPMLFAEQGVLVAFKEDQWEQFFS